MAHSTGPYCEATKKILCGSQNLMSCSVDTLQFQRINLLGGIDNIDSISSKVEKKLKKEGCDWPVFEQIDTALKIYFFCCDQEGSVVFIEIQLLNKGYGEILERNILESFQKVRKSA